MRPSNDREAVSLIIDGLRGKGIEPTVARDGENEDLDWTGDKDVFLDHLMSCDEGVMFVKMPEHHERETSFIYFVYGNDPEEVACDYGVSLEEFLDPIIKPWWS